jgi:hypothetical protein
MQLSLLTRTSGSVLRLAQQTQERTMMLSWSLKPAW